MEQPRERLFVVTNGFGQTAIGASLGRLGFELLKPEIDLLPQIFRALHIPFCLTQLQFCIMTSRVEAGDPGGLFQKGAALFRLGADERADPVLADDGRASCAG